MKVNNYGELIEKYTGGILWSYQCYGSYSGDYIAIIEVNGMLQIYKGTYGSCSGCDWLSDHYEHDLGDDDFCYEKYDVSDEDMKEYMNTFKPFIEIPKDSFPDTEEEFIALLPANSRTWIDEEKDISDFKLSDVLWQLKNPQFKNLNYLEHKYNKTNKDKKTK